MEQNKESQSQKEKRSKNAGKQKPKDGYKADAEKKNGGLMARQHNRSI